MSRNSPKKTPYLEHPQSGLAPTKYARIQKEYNRGNLTTPGTRSPLKLSRKVEGFMPYTELPVADGNFDTSRKPIKGIVLHTTVGCWPGAAARFRTPNQQASSNYLVNLDGSLIFFLEEYYTPYTNGNYASNQETITIEHEDCGNYNGPRTPALYETSKRLVADVCKFYGIPCDRSRIRKHSEVSLTGTACPDSLDVERIVREAAALLNGGESPAQPNYTQASKESAKYVYGYQTQGTLTQRMAKIIEVFKKYKVPK